MKGSEPCIFTFLNECHVSVKSDARGTCTIKKKFIVCLGMRLQ